LVVPGHLPRDVHVVGWDVATRKQEVASEIGPGDDLQAVAGRIAEVDAATTVFVVDLPGLPGLGIGPEFDAALAQPVEDAVEERVIDEEGQVLELGLHGGFGELEQHPFVEQDVREGAPRRRLMGLEDLAIEARRGLTVAADNDQVVERDRNS
jgi:hypothetical protein